VAALVLILLLGGAAAPASAHVRIFVGGVLGFPGYAYPVVYPYAVPYPYVAYPAFPPPGWVPAHWEWRYDRWGRPLRVWVPAHLQ